LVTYGAINQTNDAAAEAIIAPTNDPLQTRYNPTCGEPVIVIKNIGSNPLTTAKIQYGFAGGEVYSYDWQGNLAFLEKDTVPLPVPDWSKVTGETGVFLFELLNPNGQIDPTPSNNKLTSSFNMPLVITLNDFQFYFKTNSDPGETTWKLYNINGDLLDENKPNMNANTAYITNLSLANGSYKLCLFDSGDDGLYFPFYGTTGSAYFRRKTTLTYATIHRIDPNFGRFVQVYFAVNHFSATQITSLEPKNVTIFPNPVQSDFFIDMSGIYGKNLSVEVYNLVGKQVLTTSVSQMQINKIGSESLPSGVYLVVIKEGSRTIANSKMIKK
jgi:hypothetical protein